MKARLDFTINEGKGKRTVIKRGEDVPPEVAKRAQAAGYTQDSAVQAASVEERPSKGPGRGRSKG